MRLTTYSLHAFLACCVPYASAYAQLQQIISIAKFDDWWLNKGGPELAKALGLYNGFQPNQGNGTTQWLGVPPPVRSLPIVVKNKTDKLVNFAFAISNCKSAPFQINPRTVESFTCPVGNNNDSGLIILYNYGGVPGQGPQTLAVGNIYSIDEAADGTFLLSSEGSLLQ